MNTKTTSSGRAIYRGSEERLKGEQTLFVRRDGRFLCQFDKVTLPEAFGWHDFTETDFEIIRED